MERAAENGASIEFDEYSMSPYYSYTSDSKEHIVWFEDVRSIRSKLELAANSGIAGIGYWNFMRPFPQSYLLINSMFNIEKVYP